MILVDLAGLIVGGILAQHFRALILIPSSLIAGGGIMTVAFFDPQQGSHVLLAAFSIAAALQIGYFFGLFIKHLVADSHEAQLNTAWPG